MCWWKTKSINALLMILHIRKGGTAERKLLVSLQINGIHVHVMILNPKEEGRRSRDGTLEFGHVNACKYSLQIQPEPAVCCITVDIVFHSINTFN